MERPNRLARVALITAFAVGGAGCANQEESSPTDAYCQPGYLPEDERNTLAWYAEEGGYERIPEENVSNLSKFGMPYTEKFCPSGVPPAGFEGNLAEFLDSAPTSQTEPVPLPPTPPPAEALPPTSPPPTVPAVESQPTAPAAEQEQQAPQQQDEGWLKNAQRAVGSLVTCIPITFLGAGGLWLMKKWQQSRKKDAVNTTNPPGQVHLLKKLNRTRRSYENVRADLEKAKEIFSKGDPNSPEVEAAKVAIPGLHQEAMELRRAIYQIGQDVNTGPNNKSGLKRQEPKTSGRPDYIGGSDDY